MGGWPKAGGVEIDVLCLSRCKREDGMAFSFDAKLFVRFFFFLGPRSVCG